MAHSRQGTTVEQDLVQQRFPSDAVRKFDLKILRFVFEHRDLHSLECLDFSISEIGHEDSTLNGMLVLKGKILGGGPGEFHDKSPYENQPYRQI